jgi:CDGSH-type Zn-finger protein/truncated hemoglobin YjbI
VLAALQPTIQNAHNGPYLVTNVQRLHTYLGEAVQATPQLALCRCGESKMKPYCDGSHARIGFTDAKDPRRVPDRPDSYSGQQVTVLDNRGICQHSGLCTDRLAAVFRASQEPFVAPSGGRMDEIIRAVRDCPSGALSFAIDGQEARSQVDWHDGRPQAIEVTRDGPYRISGGIPLTDSGGNPVPRNAGSSAEHCALCRCGHSQNKPFCSGMHWYVEFRDPPTSLEPTLFEWAGGLPALTRMTRLLYEKHVPADPLLAPVFANMSLGHAQREAAWLAEAFGGPASDSQQRNDGPPPGTPPGRAFTEEQRARWVALAGQAAQEAGLPADPEFRSAFSSFVEWASRVAVAQSPGAAQPEPSVAQPQSRQSVPRWDWGPAGPPPAAHMPRDDGSQPAALPGADVEVSFAAHIRPQFRQRDRQSMTFAFDLWSYDDVRASAPEILQRLRGGSMPCDGAWASDKVAVFQRWVESGTRP